MGEHASGPKICPMLSLGALAADKDSWIEKNPVFCRRERCGWWLDVFDGCAIRGLAKAADSMKLNGLEVAR